MDLLLFRGEHDARRRATACAILVLDGRPEWDDVCLVFERASREFLRLRQHVVEPSGGLGPARWVTDPDFDLHYHLRRVRLPARATLRTLLDALPPLLMAPLDTARPLWEATLYEGLAGGRSALVFKGSHALADGLGGMQVLGRMLELEPDAPPRPMPPAPVPEDVTADELAIEALRAWPRTALAGAAQVAGRAITLGVRLWRDDSLALDYVRSLRRVLEAGGEGSPLLAGRGLSRRLLHVECGLDPLRRAAKAAGGSLNDAYLAALCGALGRYHERLGLPVETLPLGMPISTRRPDDPVGGNHFVGGLLAAPIGEPDPRRRIGILRETVRALRDEDALSFLEQAAPVLARLPKEVLARVHASLPLPDVQASNVPGLRQDVYFAGARVEKMLAVGPVPGIALMVVLVSHGDVCSLTVNYDPAAITEPALFETCLEEALAEVLALDPEARRATSPERAPAREARTTANAPPAPAASPESAS